MLLLLAAVLLLADPPKAVKADPVDLYVAGLEQGWLREVGEIRAEIAAAKRAGKARVAEDLEKKRLAQYLVPGMITRGTAPMLEASKLQPGQVGVLSGVIKAIPDEKTMVIDSKGSLVIVDQSAGADYKVGGRFESSPSVVGGTKRYDSKLVPAIYRLDYKLVRDRWKARHAEIMAAEVAAAEAADRAKRDGSKQSVDDIAKAKLELAKKATKPETRLRLLKEIVENYPASTSAAEAEKLLAEEPKE